MAAARPPLARALTVVAAFAMAGCAAAIGPAVEDAQLALRVKTAIVNDPEVGTQAIDVRAADGVVTLSGRVRSAADRDRAVALARAVPGVLAVTADLSIVDVPAPQGPPSGSTVPREQDARRLFAAGVSVASTRPSTTGLGDALHGGLLVRLPVRNGLGPAIGFSWTTLDITEGPEGALGLARLRVRPVMLGLAYSYSVGRTALSASVVGGLALNDVRVSRTGTGPLRAIDAENSFVWRPGVSVWHDVGPRIGVNLFVGGLFANPRVTFASDDELRVQRMRTDAVIVSAGLAYWLF